jgi:copper resistance protein C
MPKLKVMRVCKSLPYIVILSQLLLMPSVHAEGMLINGTPKDDAELSNFDGKISLTFTGNVGERSPSLLVVDAKGTRVDNKDLALTIGPRSTLTGTTPKLAPGSYALRYRVVTEDGLVVSGIRKFTIKN